MNSSEDDVQMSPEATALIELARRSFGSMSLQQRSRGLARVTARIAKRGLRGSPWALAGVAAGVAVLAFAVRTWVHPAPPAVLSYAFEGGMVAGDGSLTGSTAGDRPTMLRFSDGTQIELGKGARAHIASLTEHGARVSLDEGEVHARVVHWEGSRWLFDAGPFVVTVIGTAFALSWTPGEERIDLRLENGSVEVGGPIFDQPIALRSGKWLTIRLRQREVLIRDIASADAAAAPSANALAKDAPIVKADPSSPELGEEDAAAGTRAPSGSPRPPVEAALTAESAPAKRDWAAKVAAGKFEEIIEEAERAGVAACLASASSGELASLADAARYTKRGGLARQALLAQRQRFGGSGRAAEAAFLLGRLAESTEGPAAAVPWFDRYLAEAPSGAFAPEALGRKMVLVEKTSGRDAAAKVAQEYLRRFPKGTYARAAGALLRAP